MSRNKRYIRLAKRIKGHCMNDDTIIPCIECQYFGKECRIFNSAPDSMNIYVLREKLKGGVNNV